MATVSARREVVCRQASVVILRYVCCANQKSINMSVIHTVPRIFSHPPAYPGFS